MAFEITRIDRRQIEPFYCFYVDIFYVTSSLEKEFTLTYPAIPYSDHLFINKTFVGDQDYLLNNQSLKFFDDRTMVEGDEIYITYVTRSDVDLTVVLYSGTGEAITTENGDFIRI